jgi:AcrR family transcriptional regulator
VTSTIDRKPGRPRSERARQAVLTAAAELLVEGGMAAVTMEAVAARASVSKVTVYKWWPSRGAVAVDAYFEHYRQTITFPDTGDLAKDLQRQMSALLRAFSGRAGAIMAELIGQAQSDAALSSTLLDRWIAPRRDATRAVLRRAIERGQLRADLDLEAFMDQLYAPLYFRLIVRHQALDPRLPRTLIRQALEGARPASVAEAHPTRA